MSKEEARKYFEKGLKALAEDEPVRALSCFEKAHSLDPTPEITSHLALCIARERGQINKAIQLCEEAISKDGENPVHYLNLGRIYLLKKDKVMAIKSFREGLKTGEHQGIIEELNRLGTRKPPVIPFLPRKNRVNKYLGLILSKLGLR